jgi:hypothetical protein
MPEKPFRYLDDVPKKETPVPSPKDAARLLGLGKPAAKPPAKPAPKPAKVAPKPAPKVAPKPPKKK